MLSPHLFKTTSAGQTKKLAGLLAREILGRRMNKKSALIFALTGDLGTGKTTFIQGFLKALGIRRKITSPTFVLIKNYKLAYHVDCYRIKKPSELLKLGLKEILDNPQNIVLIEWAEKIKRILAEKSIWIKLEHSDKINQRIIKIT